MENIARPKYIILTESSSSLSLAKSPPANNYNIKIYQFIIPHKLFREMF